MITKFVTMYTELRGTSDSSWSTGEIIDRASSSNMTFSQRIFSIERDSGNMLSINFTKSDIDEILKRLYKNKTQTKYQNNYILENFITFVLLILLENTNSKVEKSIYHNDLPNYYASNFLPINGNIPSGLLQSIGCPLFGIDF